MAPRCPLGLGSACSEVFLLFYGPQPPHYACSEPREGLRTPCMRSLHRPDDLKRGRQGLMG